MNKKRKGFTLTELIAVVAILALILLIAIPAYNSIRARILQRQYENLVLLIEENAVKYASVNGTNIINVQALIDAGLLETDDGTNIFDPRDKSIMNCIPIQLTYNKGKYKADLLEDAKKECNLTDLQSYNGTIDVIVTSATQENVEYKNKDVWIRDKVKLKVDTSTLGEENIVDYKWVSANGQTGSDAVFEPIIDKFLNTTVNVEVTTDRDNKYFALTALKIDLEEPEIQDIEVSGGSDWAKGRKVSIKATDKNGSGIAGYYIGKEACDENSEFEELSDTTYEKVISASDIGNSANYYICVKDKVGNTEVKSESIVLSIKDNVAPECTWSGENTSWTNSDVKIKVGCVDDNSGCNVQYSSYEKTYDKTTVTDVINYTIKDNAGNSTNCSKTVDVYVDKDVPTVPNIKNSANGLWSDSNINVSATSSDIGSGIKEWYTSSDDKSWSKVSTSNLSNENTSYKTTYSSEGNRTTYLKVCDQANNCSKNSTWVGIDKCESPTRHEGAYGTCSRLCGAGQETRTVTYKGISGKTCSTTTESRECNLGSCTPTVSISGNIKNWVCGSCKSSCSTSYRVLDGSTCMKSADGYYGNTMGKVTFSKTDNKVTFDWEIRQGAATWIGNSYWVKFIVRNDSSQVFSTYLKRSSGTWEKGSTHTGSLTYTFNTKGTYYIYIEGNSDNPSFNMNFGTITVS